jgi:hypothetical protein
MLLFLNKLKERQAKDEQQDLGNKQPVSNRKNHSTSFPYFHQYTVSPFSGKAESAKRIEKRVSAFFLSITGK